MKPARDRSRLAQAVVVLLSIAGGACGGGGGTRANDPDGGGMTTPATASAACSALHAARAAYDARCRGGSVTAWRAFEDGAEDCAVYDRHVAAGTVLFQPDGWEACLAQYDQACAQAVLTNCPYETLHGTVPDGQPCEDSAVCGNTSGCIDLGGGACGQICAGLGQLNQACGIFCGDATPCYPAPFCTPGLVCNLGICVAGGAVGDPCGGPSALACRPVLFCDTHVVSADGTGTCAARVAGGPCVATADCLLDEFCLGGTCTPRRGAGATCADASDACGAWLVCDPASVVCRAAGAVGQACAPFPGAPDYLTCSAGTCANGVTCTAVAKAGQGCAAASCAAGLVCDSAAVTCVPCS